MVFRIINSQDPLIEHMHDILQKSGHQVMAQLTDFETEHMQAVLRVIWDRKPCRCRHR